MKSFIKEILQYFPLFNLEKVNNIVRDKNIHNKHFYLLEKSIKPFSVNKFRNSISFDGFEFVKPIKKLSSCIETVTKVLDGSTGDIISNNFYCKTGFVDNILSNNGISILKKISLHNKENYGKASTINFYNNGFCLYPLASNNSFNNNSYIYTIYKYIYLKTHNSYVSCFIALFYCYIGRLFSLIKIYKKNDINVLESNLSTLIAKLSAFVSLINRENVTCCSPQLVSIRLINIINMSLALAGAEFYKYKPYLIGLSKYILTFNGIFAKLGFQETLKTLKNIIFEHKIDWKVDSESNIIVSDFIPVGSGWYRYFID